MENSLVNQIQKYITPELLSKLASQSGESESAISKGIGASVPAILAGLLGKSQQGGLGSLLSKVKDVIGGSTQTAVSHETSFIDIAKDLFGGNWSAIVAAIASYAGINSSAVSGLLGASSFGIFDHLKQTSGLEEGSVNNLLQANKNEISSALPSGLSWGALGLGGLGLGLGDTLDGIGANIKETFNDVKENVTEKWEQTKEVVENKYDDVKENVSNTYDTTKDRVNTTYDDNKGGGSPWKYIIPLVIIGALAYFLLKNCNKDKETTTTTTENVDTLGTTTTTTTTTERVTREVLVNDNVKLNAYADGIEEKLVAFLNKGDYKTMTEDQLKEMWFDFDNLNFEHGTANVLPESQVQLENIAQILTAYPNVKIKIGGYTDKTGDEAVNKKISTERAEAVKKFLTDKGLAKQVVGAEGYGSEFAVQPADASEELRVTDRKVSVSVRN